MEVGGGGGGGRGREGWGESVKRRGIAIAQTPCSHEVA